jgi:hypothetical protein
MMESIRERMDSILFFHGSGMEGGFLGCECNFSEWRSSSGASLLLSIPSKRDRRRKRTDQ